MADKLPQLQTLLLHVFILALGYIAGRRTPSAANLLSCTDSGRIWHGFKSVEVVARNNAAGAVQEGSCWCGEEDKYCLCTPSLSIDVIVHVCGDGRGESGIVMVKRAKPPYGWSLPGGYVSVGESVETAATRELEEETGIKVSPDMMHQQRVFSSPGRDPRRPSAALFFATQIAMGQRLEAGDDAVGTRVVPFSELTDDFRFAFSDVQIMLSDYVRRAMAPNAICNPSALPSFHMQH